jgi:hypothetical protein
VAIVKAAMLKLEATAAGGLGPMLGPSGESATWGTHVLRSIDHPSSEVRLLTVEMLSGTDNLLVRERFTQRLGVEQDRDVRDAIERALSAMRRQKSGTYGP